MHDALNATNTDASLVSADATCPPPLGQPLPVPLQTHAPFEWKVPRVEAMQCRPSSSVAPDRLTACMSCSSVRQTLGQPQGRARRAGEPRAARKPQANQILVRRRAGVQRPTQTCPTTWKSQTPPASPGPSLRKSLSDATMTLPI